MRSRAVAIAAAIRGGLTLDDVIGALALVVLVWVLLNVDTTQAWLWGTP
jgi:hypothetical protein